MSKSNSQSNPQTTSSVAPVDNRIGVDGTGNRVLGNGATDLGGGIQGGSAPIAAQTFSDTGDVFAPQFNFGGRMPYDPLNPGYDPDDQAYAYQNYQAPQNSYTPPTSTGSRVPDAPANFGGAAQTGGVVTGGNVSGPVASGSDSIAQQVTGGGAAVAGDNFAPIITNPGNGPTLAAGGDLEFNGSIFNDNTAPISITDASEEIVTAAIDSNERALTAALSSGERSVAKSLEFALNATKDPSENVSRNAFQTVAVVAVILGVVAWATRRKAV